MVEDKVEDKVEATANNTDNIKENIYGENVQLFSIVQQEEQDPVEVAMTEIMVEDMNFITQIVIVNTYLLLLQHTDRFKEVYHLCRCCKLQ